MTEFSPADARLHLLRRMSDVFLGIMLEGKGATVDEDELAEDMLYAEGLSTDVLEALGLEVLAVDADGSMTVRVTGDAA